jgi:methylase of polypeptide subunit release factors
VYIYFRDTPYNQQFVFVTWKVLWSLFYFVYNVLSVLSGIVLCFQQVMDRLFPKIPDLLSQCGVFYLTVISENCPDDVKQLMNELGFNMHIVKERKVRSEHLLVLKFTRK